MQNSWRYRVATSTPAEQAVALLALFALLGGLFLADNVFFGGKKALAAPRPSPSASPSVVSSPSPDPVPTTSPNPNIPMTSTVASAAVNLVTARSNPDPKASVVATLHQHNIIGQVQPFLVVDQQPGWVKVLLPVSPNGTTGWISDDQITPSQVSDYLVASLSSFTLKHYVEGRLAETFPMADGAAASPTPTGLYYVYMIQQNPGPPYDPVIFAISAFSPQAAAKGWPLGGIVGIHGWGDASVEGHAVSNGCLRLTQSDATKLMNSLPMGTPVEIDA